MDKYGWTSTFLILVISFSFMMAASIESRDIMKIEYEVSADLGPNESVELIIPMPNMPHEVRGKNGIENISKDENEFGVGYRMHTNSSFYLRIEGSERRVTWRGEQIEDSHHDFSMQNDTNDDGVVDKQDLEYHWIYLNGTDEITLNVSVFRHHEKGSDGSNYIVNESFTLTPGWNKVFFLQDFDPLSYVPFWPFIPFGCLSMIIQVLVVVVWVGKTVRKRSMEQAEIKE